MSEKIDHPYKAVRCPFCKSYNTITYVPIDLKLLLKWRYWKMWCGDCLKSFLVDKKSKSGMKIVRKGRKAVDNWNMEADK